MQNLVHIFDPASQAQKKIKVAKDRVMLPFIKILLIVRPSPNAISVFGFIVGAYSVWLLFQNMYWWFVLVMLISVLLDGVDGAYARHTGQSSEHGANLDRFIDVSLMAAMYVGLTWYIHDWRWLFGLGLYGVVLLIDTVTPKQMPIFPGRMALFVPVVFGFPRIGFIVLIVFTVMAGIRIVPRLWQPKIVVKEKSN